MNRTKNPIPMPVAIIVGGLLCVLVIIIATTRTNNMQPPDVNNVPPVMGAGARAGVTPVSGRDEFYAPRRDILGSASPDEVGQFAQQFARTNLRAQGPIEVLLSRPVKWEEVPTLGLGCLPDFASIEEPPLMLVILKGDFDVNNAMPSPSSTLNRRFPYAVYVFDLWAASPVYLTGSATGGLVREALNNPNLPIENSHMPRDCGPRAPKSHHYGSTPPGFYFPPASEMPPTVVTTPEPPPPMQTVIMTAPPQIPTVDAFPSTTPIR